MSLRLGTTFIAGTPDITGKANIDASNFTTAGKSEIVSFGRQFTNLNTTVAQGTTSIAGSYNLGMTDTTSVKLGLFYCFLPTLSPGSSSMSLQTDAMTGSTLICQTNNGFATAGTALLPFKNSITIAFPETSAGVDSNTKLIFVGYM